MRMTYREREIVFGLSVTVVFSVLVTALILVATYVARHWQ